MLGVDSQLALIFRSNLFNALLNDNFLEEVLGEPLMGLAPHSELISQCFYYARNVFSLRTGNTFL